jgi:outer membrane protein, heavy metal efflux system
MLPCMCKRLRPLPFFERDAGLWRRFSGRRTPVRPSCRSCIIGLSTAQNHLTIPDSSVVHSRLEGSVSPAYRERLTASYYEIIDKVTHMKRMTDIGLLFLLSLFTAGAGWGLSLDEAVRTALARNPGLNALRLEQEVARGQLQKAQLPLAANPTLESSGSRKDRSPEEGSGKVTNYGVKLSQEFEIAGQRGIRIDVAHKNLARVDLEIRDRARMLSYEVKAAYALVLAYKERAALAMEVARLQEDLLALTVTKYRAGDVSALETNLAEVEVSKARRDVLTAERNYREAVLALQGLMGDSPDSRLVVEGQLAPESVVMPDKETLRKTLPERPDVKAAAVESDRAGQAEKLIRREAIPSPTLGAFHNRDEQRNDTGIALSLSIPIFDRKQAERREAQARAQQARIRQTGLGRTVEREFEQEYMNLLSARQELSVYRKEIIAKSLENLELLNLAFKEGKISFFDVRLAQRDTVELRFGYLDSLLRAQQALYAVERAIGGDLR